MSTNRSLQNQSTDISRKKFIENASDYERKVERYLQKHKIFDIFSNLCQKLTIEKPKNALEFMISELEKGISKYK